MLLGTNFGEGIFKVIFAWEVTGDYNINIISKIFTSTRD